MSASSGVSSVGPIAHHGLVAPQPAARDVQHRVGQRPGRGGRRALRAVRIVGLSRPRTRELRQRHRRRGDGVLDGSSSSTAEATYVADSWYGLWKNTDQSLESSSRLIGSGETRTSSSASARSLGAR